VIDDQPVGGALKRLGLGGGIALVAAILLFILMFQQWYGPAITVDNNLLILGVLFTTGGTAWQALEVTPIFLALAIAVGVGTALLRAVGSDRKPVVLAGAAVCVLGGLASLLVLYRIISPPEAGSMQGIPTERGLQTAIYFALLAALGIAYGGWLIMRDEGTSFGLIAKSLESPHRPPRRKSST
jgi:hypothetical protein